MSSKAARRRQRERQRRRQQTVERDVDDLRAADDEVACADAQLATTRALLDDATEVLVELSAHAVAARDAWPAGPGTDELRAVFEAARSVAIQCCTALQATRDRAARCQDDDRHLHVLGGRVVEMAVVAAPDPDLAGADDDIPF
jgi:hypothetical protein